MRPLTHNMTVEIAGSEIEVEFSFTCSAIIPATGPSYSSGGEPASGGEVEIISATALIESSSLNCIRTDRFPVPAWMIDILQQDESVTEALFNAGTEEMADDAAYAAELKADERREEAA